MLRLQTTLALVATAAHAIIVTPGSPCSSNCGNVLDSTNPDDLVCGQDQYSSSNGQVFQSCVDCQLSSTYSRSGQSDTQMMLYNMRYVTSYCLFGYPENQNAISTPCITSKACGPFQDAIQFNNLTTDITNYDYCAAWPVTDSQDFDGCKECLRAGEQYYLANFVAVLQAGCEQQPVAGRPLSVEGELFSLDHVNGTTASTDDLIDPSWFDQGPLDMGARVGIAIGGIVFILSILGFCVVWRGKRKRRAYLRTLEAKYANQNWPSPGSQAEMFETPVSQQALRGWNDSPLTSTTERTYPRYFSPYSSQFNSPVSAQDGPLMQWPAAVQGPPKVIGVALGGQETHDNWLSPIGDDKGKTRVVETYELHEVQSVESDEPEPRASRQQQAPVLHHPGYGRTSSSPPRQYAPN